MAQNRVSGRRNSAGVAAKKPPHIIIFRNFNRTYSVGTVVLFPDDSAELDAAAKLDPDRMLYRARREQLLKVMKEPKSR